MLFGSLNLKLHESYFVDAVPPSQLLPLFHTPRYPHHEQPQRRQPLDLYPHWQDPRRRPRCRSPGRNPRVKVDLAQPAPYHQARLHGHHGFQRGALECAHRRQQQGYQRPLWLRTDSRRQRHPTRRCRWPTVEDGGGAVVFEVVHISVSYKTLREEPVFLHFARLGRKGNA